ncbi:MAG: tRNA pseudouridine(38-40) synthase TruA [Acidobacteriota bacterium]
MARTLKLTIAYDGTEFSGWQRQAADRTVQAVIEDALEPLEGERAVLTAAGRTDAGVHAAGQVASATVRTARPTRELHRALNATLPPDVRIMAIEEVPAGFNARFDARAKTYRYWIWSGDVLPPALRRTAWHVPQVLDLVAMREAAAALVGPHDFASFQAAGSDVSTTVRELMASTIAEYRQGCPAWTPSAALGIEHANTGRLLCYEVTGTGFLRHMVRNIVGTLVEIGRGRRRSTAMSEILASRNRAHAAATAPPHGLVLWSVGY